VCVPGNTVDESFAGRSPVHRAIYEALMDHLSTLGPVYVDAVRVGVFLSGQRKFAEVRPKARSLSLWLGVPVDGVRTWRRVTLRRVEDVTDEVRGWLTQAYLAAEE
jgi:predicted transport protein